MALVRMLAFKPGGQGAVARSAPLAPAAVKATVPLNLPTPAAAMPAAVAAAPVVPKAAPPDEFDDSPPWDTADDAPVAQSARGDLPSAANWPQVSQEVPAKGLTRQALVQAELVDASREGDVLQIVLRTAIKAYTEPTMVTRLESVLGQYYESTVRLQMQFGEAQQTAHAVQSETRRQALEGAKQTLQEDPFLKDIQNLMGATVVSGSERTLSNTGPADI